jgi:hypothetical protein
MNPYTEEIAAWDWLLLRRRCEQSLEPIDKETLVGMEFLGTVFALTPSGKYYMPWCTNVTEEEADQDSLWFEALESIAETHGLTIESGEGDPCDIFAALYMPNDGKDEDGEDEFFEDEPSGDGEDDYGEDEDEPKKGSANGN